MSTPGSVKIGCRDTPGCTPRMFRLSRRAPETDGLIRPAGERLICAAAEDVAYYHKYLEDAEQNQDACESCARAHTM